MRVKTSILLLSVLFCLTASVRAQNSVFGPSSGTVRGTVFDDAGGLEGLLIVIDGTGGKREVRTNSEGVYEATVPPGTYSVSLKPSQPDPAYRPFQRAKFRLLPGEVKIIDLSPYSGFDYCSSKGERVVNLQASQRMHAKSSPIKPPRYERYSIASPTGPMELMIEYCERKQRNDSIKYRSAMITFDESTIYTDSAVFYPRTRLLKVGNKDVELVTREQHSIVPNLRVSFTGGNTYIDIPKGFTSSVQSKGRVVRGEQSFEIAVGRDSPIRFFYQDRQKGITFLSNPNGPFFVKTVSRGVVTLSGSGTLSSLEGMRTNGYYDFRVTLKTYPNTPSTLTMEIPQLEYQRSINTPPNAVIIERERELYDVADPKFTENGVKNTAFTRP
jgi:hypothetical protein